MAVRRRGNKLDRWEISLIKAMVADRRWSSDQDILAYFTRPTRSINHRAIGEIRTGSKHAAAKAATPEELETFLASWPDVDPETGLSVRGDELLIKSREAMIAAVHTFNSAGLTFRAELFIVTAIISWTYLLHAWLKREGIDYRHTKTENDVKVIAKTPNGAEKYWELAQCLKHARCPVEQGAKDNLEFLLDLRHEIEHRSTNRIDDAVSAKLQACCINFNDAIKTLFGAQYALERRLPIALQFVTFSPDQRGGPMKPILFLALGAAMAAGDAEAATHWRWQCAGPGFEATGEFTTEDKPGPDGYYFITGVTGEANGVPVTGMQPAKTAIPGNEGWPVDNLIREAKPQLSPGGFGVALADGSFANPFFGEHFDPPGFLAVVSNPARHVWREPRVNFEAVLSDGP